MGRRAGGKNKTTKERVKFARRVRQGRGGVETEFTLKRRDVRARSKRAERWRCRSGEPLIRFRDPDSAPRATRDKFDVKFRIKSTSGPIKN